MTRESDGAPARHAQEDRTGLSGRFIGVDIGAEALKLVQVQRESGTLHITRREILEHGKQPGQTLVEVLRGWDWTSVNGAAISGRFSGQVKLPRIPAKQAQIRAYQFLFGQEPGTLVTIGSHGFSVLELHAHGNTIFRENSRCSQGTGNFLRQLVERFSLTVEEASDLCAQVNEPAPLSGRCPVILKTDMTHLANKGEERARILAGLFDAVCENILVMLKPGRSPQRVRLAGGVGRSQRVQRVFSEALARQGMELVPFEPPDSLCMEALGCALLAAESPGPLPSLPALLASPPKLSLESLPPLVKALPHVKRLPPQPWAHVNGEMRRLVLGFDIGSTGAKLVALDVASREVVWEGYRQTLGEPVRAAQELLRKFQISDAAKYAIVGFGATGSGREIVGSLLISCYGPESVFVVNEIVAHATGALHYDSRVDTIFEIGGQDAKYIRLAEGRIIDCAMNEACSAGTGSFIEEQGRKFASVRDVRHLGEIAMTAPGGVSLGQHCSVFMAEVIEQSVAAGVEPSIIISGLYDSIIKNYLNRVKGNRSVGKVIFCQGMPFSADALAAAVARQTGSQVIVPPNPGTVGALGIALLAVRERNLAPANDGLDLALFLEAQVERKDTFVCGSNRGCGAAGNHCRIERLRTVVNDHRSLFTWGGGCALHDKGTRKKKLPDLAPDPFRQREELLERLLAGLGERHGGPRIALADEFMLKGLFPFFAGYLHQAGFDLEVVTGAGTELLKRGIQAANVPFCAPMQLFHGVAERMADTEAQWLLVPMVRSLPSGNAYSVLCPIVQAGPEVVGGALQARRERAQVLAPRLDFGPDGFESPEFLASCRRFAKELGLSSSEAQQARLAGVELQRQFQTAGEDLGKNALEFCRAHQVVPVVVLGRSYTIHNRILNSNVPALLREQGAIGIPVDCYPLEEKTPQFGDMYWAYGQSVLRAAHQVRRTAGVYGLYCSNYSCGPDSFNLHFVSHIMEGKPFAIIETDGHTGDAGTKTRLEAFLHCVEEDRRPTTRATELNDFTELQSKNLSLRQIGRVNGDREKLLIPALGRASEAVAAVFRGVGLDAEALPAPDAESLRFGRRCTSGKECLPMPLTLGSLLQRLERAKPNQRFVYVMPSTNGPCRFGVYNLLNQIVLKKLGWAKRLRIWSPKDTGYFDDLPPGTEMLVLAGILGTDLLLRGLLEVRPVETAPGTAEAIHNRYLRLLLTQLEAAAKGDLSLGPALWQVTTGRLFGVRDLLRAAGAEFAAVRGTGRKPVVELTGEIYVRAVPFANDFLVEKLEARGLTVRMAPQSEWIAYCGYLQRQTPGRTRLLGSVSGGVHGRIEAVAYKAMGGPLRWPPPPTIPEALDAARPYVSPELLGEAVLTIGGSRCGWQRGEIDAVISVGPLECMPTKIAEAQFLRLGQEEKLLSLTLSYNGEPLSPDVLDNFAFEVHERFRRSSLTRHSEHPSPLVGTG